MSRGACSHCWGEDHDKRKCPRLAEPVEKLRAETLAANGERIRRERDAEEAIGEVLLRFPRDRWNALLLGGLKKADHAAWRVMAHLQSQMEEELEAALVPPAPAPKPRRTIQ